MKKPKEPKFTYTSKKQVKITPPKFTYTSKSQVRIKKPTSESLASFARNVVFETKTDKLTVINPKTKNKIKVLSALGYPHEHPAYKAAVALLKKKKITLPPNLHAVKKGEQIPLFNLKPFEDPRRVSVSRFSSALVGESVEELFTETQRDYFRSMSSDQTDAIREYTGTAFGLINAYLRGDLERSDEFMNSYFYDNFVAHDEEKDPTFLDDRRDELISNLETAFDGSGAVLQKDVLVFRGITDKSIVNDILAGGVGTTVEDDGFMSTSVSEQIARGFSSSDTKSSVLLKIVLRKGTRALYPPAGGLGVEGESEVIVKAGVKMRVLSIHETFPKNDANERGYIFVVETVPEEA